MRDMAANPIPQFRPEQKNTNMYVLPSIEQEIREANQSNQIKVSSRQEKNIRVRKLILAAATVIAIFPLLQIANQVGSILSVNSMISDAKVTNTKLQKQNVSLKLQNTNLDNPDYLEQVLRDKYHYAKNGETIFNLPNSALSN